MAKISISGVDQAVRDLNKIDKEFTGVGKSASEGLGIAGRAGHALSGALIAATATGAAALVGFGVSAVKVASEYESTLNRFSSVAGSAIEDAGMSMSQFNDLALDMGAKTQFSAGQAADAMVELAKGGLDPATIAAGGLKGALDLAAAGELGLSQAANITAKQLGIWGDQGVTAADVANQLAKAANASTVDVDDLALGLANAGGSAKVAGLDFREVTQTMALLAPGFSSAADAGTSLKAMLANLTPESNRQIDAFRTLNLLTADGKSKFFDLQGQFVGMEQASRLLSESTKGLSQEQKVMALNAAFGSDAIRVAALLADQGAEGYRAMGTAMDGAGTAAEQAAKRNQGLGFAVESLKGSLETIEIVVGSALIPTLTKFVNTALIPGANALLGFAQEVTAADDPMHELGSRIDAILPGFQGTVTVVGTAADIIGDNLVPALEAGAAATLAYGVTSLPAMSASLTKAIPLLYAKGAALTASLGPFALVAGAAFLTAKAYDAWTDGLRKNVTKQMEASEVMQEVADLQAEIAASTTAQTPAVAAMNAQLQAQTDKYAELALQLEKQAATGVQSQGRMAQAQREGKAALAEQEAAIAATAEKLRILLQWQDAVAYSQEHGVSAGSAYVAYLGQDLPTAAGAAATALRELTDDEIKHFSKVVEDTLKSIPESAAGAVDSIVGLYDTLASTTAEHEDALATLIAEKGQAKTEAARAAVDDRIAAENSGFEQSRDQALEAYAQEQADLRQHLGESLIARVEAQGALYGATQEQIGNLTGLIASEYGIEQSLSDQTFSAMIGHVDAWAASSNRSALSTMGALRDTEAAAVSLKEQEDKLTGEYRAQFIHDFEAGKLSAEELSRAISQIPAMVRSTLETNWQSQLAAIRDVGDAMSRLPVSKLIRIEAIIDPDLKRHSPAPIEQVMASIEAFESKRHVIDIGLSGDIQGSLLPEFRGSQGAFTTLGGNLGHGLMHGLLQSIDADTSQVKKRLLQNLGDPALLAGAREKARLLGRAVDEGMADELKKQPTAVKQTILRNLGDPSIVREVEEKSRNLGAASKKAVVRGFMEQSEEFLRDAINLGDPKLLEDAYEKGKAIGKEAARGVADGARGGANAFLDAISGPATGATFGSGTPNAGGVQYIPGSADLGRKSAEEMTNAWTEAMARSQPDMLTSMTDTLTVLNTDSIKPWAEGMNEYLELASGFWIQSIADGISGNRAAVDAASGQGHAIAAAVNAGLSTIERDITVNVHANIDPALERHSPSILEQTLMSIHDLAGSVPVMNLRTSGGWDPLALPEPVYAPSTSNSPSWSLPELAMPYVAASAPASGPGRSGGDVHLHMNVDLRGSELSLAQVEARIRRVAEEAGKKNPLLHALRSIGYN